MLGAISHGFLTCCCDMHLVNEVTEDVYKNFMPHWNGRYLASNVYFKDVNNNKTVPIG